MSRRKILDVLLVLVTIPLLFPTGLLAAQGGGTVLTPENAAQVELIATLGRGVIHDLAWSPDGTWLAVATSRGIELLDGEDLSAPPRLLGPEREVTHLAWHPDGTRLAAAESDGSLLLWDMSSETSEQLIAPREFPPTVSELIFSPNGELIAIASTFHGEGPMPSITVFDVRDKKLVAGLPLGQGTATAALFINNRLLMGCAMDGVVMNVQTGDYVMGWGRTSTLTVDSSGTIYAGWFNGAQSFLAVDPADFDDDLIGSITIEALNSYIYDGIGFGDDYGEVELSANEQILLGLAPDFDNSTLAAWDVTSTQVLGTLELPGYSHMAAHPQQPFLAISDRNAIYILYYGYWYGLTPVQTGYEPPIKFIALSDDGVTLAVARSNNFSKATYVQVWDLPTQSLRYTLGHEGQGVDAVAFLGDRWLLVAGDDHVNLWNLNTGQVDTVLHTLDIGNVLLSPDRDQLALVGSDETTHAGIIQVWDLQTMQLSDQLPIENAAYFGLPEQFGPWQHLPEGIRAEDSLRINYQCNMPSPYGTLSACVAGTELYLLPATERVSPSNIKSTDEAVLNTLIHTGRITSIQFSADGTRLVSAGSDGIVNIWGIP